LATAIQGIADILRLLCMHWWSVQ